MIARSPGIFLPMSKVFNSPALPFSTAETRWRGWSNSSTPITFSIDSLNHADASYLRLPRVPYAGASGRSVLPAARGEGREARCQAEGREGQAENREGWLFHRAGLRLLVAETTDGIPARTSAVRGMQEARTYHASDRRRPHPAAQRRSGAFLGLGQSAGPVPRMPQQEDGQRGWRVW